MESLTNVSTEPGTGKHELVDDKNYAADPITVTRIKDEILAQLPQIRQIRMDTQARWTRFRQCYDGVHNKKLYQGRADLYWRLAYQAIEKFVAHIKMQVFPTTDSFYIEPSPFDPFSSALAPQIRRLIRHDVEQARVERHLDRFLRNALIEGPAIVKFIWKVNQIKQIRRTGVAQPSMMPGQQGNPLAMFNNVLTTYEGPTFLPIRNLDFYVHPITVQDIDDARLVFEDVTVDKAHIRSMVKENCFDLEAAKTLFGEMPKNGPIVQETAGDKDAINAKSGISEQHVLSAMPGTYVLQEIWTKFDLAGDGYEVPVKIVACKDIILEARQNPLFGQRPPYRSWKAIDRDGNFYGQGLIEPAEHINIAANAVGNQMLDAIAYQTNHITGVNIALLGTDLGALRLAPRAWWPTLGDPNQVFKEIRPPDNTQSALMGLQLLSGTVQDVMGAPATIQGKFTNAEKTAAEVNTAAMAAFSSIDAMVRNVESQVLSPMLYDWFLLEQQFRAVASSVKITGTIPIKLQPQDLVGDYGFRWLVSSQIPPIIAQMLQQMEAMMGGASLLGAPPSPGGAGGMSGGGGGSAPGGGPAQIGPQGIPALPAPMGLGSSPNMGL